MKLQAYVVIIAVILMCLIIYLINTTIISQAGNTSWPTYIPNCPDYWVDYNGDGSKCVASGFNITDKCYGTMDFSGKYCDKVSRATSQCSGIIWDGVTYGNGNNIKHNKCKGINVRA